MELFVDSLYDAVLDCVKVLPILFLAYLLVSLLSHDHNHKFSSFLAKNKKTSVLFASCLGCVPQCGFWSVIADLYSMKTVSLGVLVAVLGSTSDEAIPIMLSNPDQIVNMLLLIGIKLVLAIFWGYLIDFIVKLTNKTVKQKFISKENLNEIDHNTKSHHDCGHIHTEECVSSCGHKHGDCCSNNIFWDAVMHTFNILIYIFVATFAINLIISYCGTEALTTLLTNNAYIQILCASLIGLIPNCASSVLLVQLFMYGTLTFPALLAGLSSGAGVGLFILWVRNKKRPLQNIGIVFLQYAIGVVSGLIVSLFF